MDCPNKNDREVQCNTAKSYKEWAQAKRDQQAKRLRLFMAAETSLANRASKLETTWQQEGHPSLAQAQCALACAEKATLPSVRVFAYAKLKGRAEPASTLVSNSLLNAQMAADLLEDELAFLVERASSLWPTRQFAPSKLSLRFSGTFTSPLVYLASTCRLATRNMPKSQWKQ